MKTLSRISAGDPLKADWANAIVANVNHLTKDVKLEKSNIRHTYRPFQPIALWYKDGSGWYMKIQEAFFFDDSASPIIVGTVDGDKELGDYPEILIPSTKANPKNLVFNYSESRIGFQSPGTIGNLTILEFVYSEEEGNESFSIKQQWGSHVDLRRFPPLTELVCNNGVGQIKVGLTDGYVCERIPTYSVEDALKNWFPVGIKDGDTRIFNDISEEQSLACIVQVDKDGRIFKPEAGEAVEIKVETNDTLSTHYKPAVAQDEGHAGIYHYKLLKDGWKRVLSRSHIDHFQDITKIINVGDDDPCAANEGRVVKEYNEQDSQYELRRITRSGSQLTVNETASHIAIGGNGKAGSYTVGTKTGDGDISSIAFSWSDGLVTNNGNQSLLITVPEEGDAIGTLKYKVGGESTAEALISWDKGLVQETANLVIPIPGLAAGPGIIITEADNLFTISTPLSGWIEKSYYVCESGVPTLRTFLVKP